MKTPYIKKFKAPLYRTPIWLVIHTNVPKAIDYVEDLVDVNITPSGWPARAYVYGYSDESRILLFLTPSSTPGEIAHEVKHVVNLIFKSMGVRLSLGNDEHECYYLEELLNIVHNTLKRFKDKKKSKVSLASNEIIV